MLCCTEYRLHYNRVHAQLRSIDSIHCALEHNLHCGTKTTEEQASLPLFLLLGHSAYQGPAIRIFWIIDVGHSEFIQRFVQREAFEQCAFGPVEFVCVVTVSEIEIFRSLIQNLDRIDINTIHGTFVYRQRMIVPEDIVVRKRIDCIGISCKIRTCVSGI